MDPTQLLLIGITSVFDLIVTVVSAVIAILVFSAATQGYWFVKTRLWETLALLLIAFSLFRPGYWWDMVYPPTVDLPASQLETQVEQMNPGEFIQLNFEGMTIEGDQVSKTVSLQLDSPDGDATQRLESMGLMMSQQGDQWIVDLVVFGSAAEKSGVDFGWELTGIQQQTDRPPKELVFIPTLLLLVFIGWLQRRRMPQNTAATA